ncbi:SCP2 sterol-binding domain-containing protein [Cytobacillus gottheilii]|uniref:SCP2 sterol-binding domain-containing protein n=1 Tax=Cytobacillus gottheilii TaxID=859144 RepID=A0ABX8FDB4_9BACI|nr:SCP2 sterol-binding domain-containing protein [Cytobacillus gottheilii]QVY62284.1 SCP2 sterol-binding domain-containing protein [Cytobacillus gottheilii]
MSVIAELNELVSKMNEHPKFIQDEKNRIFQVNLAEYGPLQIIIQDGRVLIEEGEAENTEVILHLNEENFSKLLKDNLNTTVAFMTGGLKVEGKMGLALKLQEIVKKYQ